MNQNKICVIKSLPEHTKVFICDCGCNNVYVSEDSDCYEGVSGEVVLL